MLCLGEGGGGCRRPQLGGTWLSTEAGPSGKKIDKPPRAPQHCCGPQLTGWALGPRKKTTLYLKAPSRVRCVLLSQERQSLQFRKKKMLGCLTDILLVPPY